MDGLSSTAPSLPPPIARQRNAIVVVLVALAIVGWVVFLNQARTPMESGMSGMGDMDMGHSTGPDLTMGRSAPLFFGMWVAMMVAMMFPAAAPMIVMYGRMKRNEPMAVGLFTGAYISLWVAFGAVAYFLGVGAEVLASRNEWVSMNWARVGGGLIVLAGIYQLTPLKEVCLRQCRTPMAFVMTHWRDGYGGAARMGFVHGLYCMGCCWLLFLVLIPLGVMNVAAMIAIALVVFVEKVMPWGRAFGRVAAAGLIVYGALVIMRPELLPTVA